MLWHPNPVKFTGEARDQRLIHDFYARPGVYVYAVRTAAGRSGVVNAYAGKAGKLGWRMIEHATATLGLMYVLYGEDGAPIFPEKGDDKHFDARIAALSGRYGGHSLEEWQAAARSQLARMEFWWLELDVRHHKAAEGALIERLKLSMQRTSGVRCINAAPVKHADGVHIPTAPAGSLLEELLGPVAQVVG